MADVERRRIEGGRQVGEWFECEREGGGRGREKDFFELISFFYPVTR